MILSSGWSMDYQVGVGPTRYLSAEFGGIAHPLMSHSCLFTRPGPHPSSPISTFPPSHLSRNFRTLLFFRERTVWQSNKEVTYLYLSRQKEMKMSSASMGGSKRRLSSRGLGGILREQRGRLYIIRRCVVMLLCGHD